MILRYTVQRLGEMIPTVLILTVLVFSMIHFLPGDPVMIMLGYTGGEARGGTFSQAVYDAMRSRLGLDQPLYLQYLNWLWRVVQGDFGNSIQTGQPVLPTILARYPTTLYMAGTALLLAIVVSIPLGILAAVRHNTLLDYITSGFSILGVCIPSFWLGLLLVLLFSLRLGWLPSIGYVPPNENFLGFLRTLTMPAIVLAVATAAKVIRFLRSDVLEQLHLDYVRTARAKGIAGQRILWRHVLKNSLITTATIVGFEMGHLLGGSTVIEVVFAWPGVSYLMLQSIYARDFPIVQGVVLLLALTVVAVNFFVDILYRALDPRIRLA